MQTFLRTSFYTVSACDAVKPVDCPGVFLLADCKTAGRTAAYAHTAGNTVVNIDRDVTATALRVYGRFCRIGCRDRRGE